MGSATTQALAATTAALDAASGVDLDTARELFAAARIVGDSPQLSGALADPSASRVARSRVVTDVFGAAFGKTTLSLLTTAVEQRWSSASQLVGTAIVGQCFGRTVRQAQSKDPVPISQVGRQLQRVPISFLYGLAKWDECRAMKPIPCSLTRRSMRFTRSSATSPCFLCPHQIRTSVWFNLSSFNP